MPFTTDLYSAHEIARAAGVPEERVIDVLGGRDVLVSQAEAARIGRALIRSSSPLQPWVEAPLFSCFTSSAASTRNSLPLALSGTAHAVAVVSVVLLTTLGLEPNAGAAALASTTEPARLVFLVSPGPGGGGGGGGRLQKSPPPAARREGRQALNSPLPARIPPIVARPDPPEPTPLPKDIEPLPVVVAPVVTAPADTQDRAGVLEEVRSSAESRGAGRGGGVGAGTGTGLGEGDGPGIGPGSGGGTGGGPYRPGSGVEAPRLLSEVKPDYTDEARRRGLEGEVVLEIVVRRDGTVGDVKILQGLGAGLNERAIQAVRRWRFAPARLRGAAVDVVVEASVEFRMR